MIDQDYGNEQVPADELPPNNVEYAGLPASGLTTAEDQIKAEEKLLEVVDKKNNNIRTPDIKVFPFIHFIDDILYIYIYKSGLNLYLDGGITKKGSKLFCTNFHKCRF